MSIAWKELQPEEFTNLSKTRDKLMLHRLAAIDQSRVHSRRFGDMIAAI
jgi:hypothetical protein